jgi:tetratricopeptide (TPR) repeat protein
MLLGAVAAWNDFNWEEAERELNVALASPSAEAHWVHSCVMSGFGRFGEATAAMRRAVELDPLQILWRGVLIANLNNLGRYEEALEEGRKALDLSAEEVHPHVTMAEAHLAMGNLDLAVACAERAHRNLPQNSMPLGILAAALKRRGDTDRAASLFRQMGDAPTPILGRAWYHLLCSEIPEAARWYGKMIDAREPFAPILAAAPIIEELRASSYWPELARRMNLPT